MKKIVTTLVGAMLLGSLALPASAQDGRPQQISGDHPACRCDVPFRQGETSYCSVFPAQNTDDPELQKLWGDITKRMAQADQDLYLVLDKSQQMAYNAMNSDVNFQNFRVRPLNRLEAEAYIAFLSQRLKLTYPQECAISRIEFMLVKDLSATWAAYCARYYVWLNERYTTRFEMSTTTRATVDTTIPYEVKAKGTPAPVINRKIKRDRDTK